VGSLAAIVDPWGGHLDRPGPGDHLAGTSVPVAHRQALAGPIQLSAVLVQRSTPLGQQGTRDWSGRRESNPRSQLGKLMFCR
jgi:hypothetical protein